MKCVLDYWPSLQIIYSWNASDIHCNANRSSNQSTNYTMYIYLRAVYNSGEKNAALAFNTLHKEEQLINSWIFYRRIIKNQMHIDRCIGESFFLSVR